MIPETCSVDGCNRILPESGGARGYCAKHYRQWSRGKLGATRPMLAPGEGADIAFRLSAEDKRELEAIAKHIKGTLSDVCRAAVRAFLDAQG